MISNREEFRSDLRNNRLLSTVYVQAVKKPTGAVCQLDKYDNSVILKNGRNTYTNIPLAKMLWDAGVRGMFIVHHESSQKVPRWLTYAIYQLSIEQIAQEATFYVIDQNVKTDGPLRVISLSKTEVAIRDLDRVNAEASRDRNNDGLLVFANHVRHAVATYHYLPSRTTIGEVVDIGDGYITLSVNGDRIESLCKVNRFTLTAENDIREGKVRMGQLMKFQYSNELRGQALAKYSNVRGLYFIGE